MRTRVSTKAVIVNSDGKFLVLTNSNLGYDTHFAYIPDFPGGTVEAGETMEQSLIREVKEEIGIDITHAPREELTDIDVPFKTYTIKLYLVWANIRDVELDQEHCMFSWLTLDQMRTLHWWRSYDHMFEALDDKLGDLDGRDFIEYREARSIYA